MKRLINLYLNSFTGLSKEVWWLALVSLINRAGTMVVPFLSLYLTKELNFTLSDVGWIMTSFGLGSVAGSWLGGRFTDKIGAYQVMVFSLCGAGILFLGLQFIESFVGLCIGIFILMTVADMFRPAMFVALGTYTKPENKTRSLTLVRLAINLGFSIGPAIGGLIIFVFSYQGLFWIDGLTCLLAGFILLKLLNPKKIETTEVSINPHAKSAYTDGQFWIFVVAMVIFSFVFLQLLSTLPIYYDQYHCLSELQIGWLFAANGILIFLLEMPLVKYFESSRFPALILVIGGVFLVGLGYVILILTAWQGILMISMVLLTVGEMLAFPFSNAYAMERSKRGNAGEYMAFYSIAFSLGHVFGHNTGMQLVNKIGFEKTWFVLGILILLAMALIWRLYRIAKK
jgi:predicted MFS family arabinose efflux permease